MEQSLLKINFDESWRGMPVDDLAKKNHIALI